MMVMVSENHRNGKKLAIIIGVILAVLLIAGGLGVWAIWKSNTDAEREAAAMQSTERKLIELRKQTTDVTDDTAYNAAIKSFNESVTTSSDPEEKVRLLLEEASFASQYKKYDDAIKAGKDAEAIKPGRAVSSMIALAAEAKGDKVLAIEYLKKSITQMDQKSPVYQVELSSIQDKIRELGGSI